MEARSYADVQAALRAARAASLARPSAPTALAPAAAYGFAGWLLSWLLVALWAAWAYAPLSWWASCGIEPPSRYWVIALPTWACVSLVVLAVGYRLLCLSTVAAFHHSSTLTDAFARAPEAAVADAVPPLADLPIERVNELLYT